MIRITTLVAILILPLTAGAQALESVPAEGQPLGQNVKRLIQAFDFLGAPLAKDTVAALRAAAESRDAAKMQQLLDPHVLAVIRVSPEARVKAARGPAPAILQQGAYVPVLLKVVNDSAVTKALGISSPQAGPIYAGGAAKPGKVSREHFLDVEVYAKPPMTERLGGLGVEYVIALLASSEAGKREATLGFDVGQGTQDLGFRGEVPILFDVRPAAEVRLSVRDFDDTPTVGRFTFKDKLGRVYPSRAKRLAPDFFFQDQVYRADGGRVLLPPGEYTIAYGRGPEYRLLMRQITVSPGGSKIDVKLERWVNPRDYGFYSGDHHIHAAGCAHYTSPTEGVFPPDMFLHVKGEGLNVGCNLTWGPCFEFQRQFFEPYPNKISEPLTVLKYDIEVSGFGSQALGHVCLLNLKDQTYPGSDGTKTKGWPTWTTPLMRWAKAQGAYCGYAHSANGLHVNARAAAKRLLTDLDANRDGKLTREETAKGLLPELFDNIDTNKDGFLSESELAGSIVRTSSRLPNLAIPELDGIGAQEIFVTTSQGLCDFISAMDTQRVPEWNCWYHLMNCGFPLKVSGETDFPCISGSRVGEGRVYVQLGKVDRVDFPAWCKGLAEGRSYVSDGYAHALAFRVNGQSSGGECRLDSPGTVEVNAKVAFARQLPLGTAVGGQAPAGPTRKVEVIVNGKVVSSQQVPADDQVHDLKFPVKIEQSSWIALRQFPQLHTNPVTVLVAGKPIRASRASALWCARCIEQLWHVRARVISPEERGEAERTFQQAIAQYKKIAEESAPGS
jgi:hypothetical protein